MGVSFDTFTKAFLEKITEYDFVMLDKEISADLVDGYMKRACAQFNRICKYDLSARDDANRVFNINIPNEDIDEIIDIVSEGMIVQWLKPYTYKSLTGFLALIYKHSLITVFNCNNRVRVKLYASLNN